MEILIIKISVQMSQLLYHQSRNSTISIVTGYGLDNKGVGTRVQWSQKCSPLHIIQTGSGGSPNLLSNRYLGLFPQEWSVWDVKLITHLQLVPSRIEGFFRIALWESEILNSVCVELSLQWIIFSLS
jgi:hypothetical protein